MVKPIYLAAAITALSVAGSLAQAYVAIQTVPVENAGNVADCRFETPGHGSVEYDYKIGKYEVTAGQYTAFLNSVARTDTYGLYNTSMWSYGRGCRISRSGTPGSYTYSVAPDWGDRPVNMVSWGDAVRFCNWLHNGQPTGLQGPGTTEDGSYFLNGASTNTSLMAVAREKDATWAVPTGDEWYKAAYHKNDGVTGNYLDYPTGSNAEPSNDLVDPDPGNNANFEHAGFTIGRDYWRTEAGEFENSPSMYGTYDQAGNVSEWNEAIIGSFRCLRGGAFSMPMNSTRASVAVTCDPIYEYDYAGFRVVQVPEPSMFVAFLAGSVAAFGPFRRRILSS